MARRAPDQAILPRVITPAWLAERHACPEAVATVAARWPTGAAVTAETLVTAAGLGLGVGWLVQFLPVAPWARYETEMRSILVRYEADLAALAARFQGELPPFRARHDADLAALSARFQAEIAPLLAAAWQSAVGGEDEAAG